MLKRAIEIIERCYLDNDNNLNMTEQLARAFDAYSIATELTYEEDILVGAFLYDLFRSTSFSNELFDQLYRDMPRKLLDIKRFMGCGTYNQQVIFVSVAVADLRYIERTLAKLSADNSISGDQLLKERYAYHHDIYNSLRRLIDFEKTAAICEYKKRYERIFIGTDLSFSVDSALTTLKSVINNGESKSVSDAAKLNFDIIRKETLSNVLVFDWGKTLRFKQSYHDVLLSSGNYVKRMDSDLIIPVAIANTDFVGDIEVLFEKQRVCFDRDEKKDSFDELFNSFDTNQRDCAYVEENENVFVLDCLRVPCFTTSTDWYLHDIDMSYSLNGEIVEKKAWIIFDMKKLRRLFPD